jgi:hypothetical protein
MRAEYITRVLFVTPQKAPNSPAFSYHGRLAHVLRYSGQTARAQRSCLRSTQKIASLLLDSIGVPIEIEEYLEHGQDAHATKMPSPNLSATIPMKESPA